MSTASTIGGVLGGAIGGIYGGGNVSAGYALGSAAGGLIDSATQQKKSDETDIITQTPAQTALIEEMKMKKRALEAGTMYQPQQEQIRQMGTGALRQAARVTGGDSGAAVAAMSKIHRGTGRSLNDLYGAMMQQSMQMFPLESQMLEQIAQRQYGVSAHAKMQPMYDAMQKKKDAMGIIAGIIGQKATNAGITDESTKQKLIDEELKDKGLLPNGMPEILPNEQFFG